VGHISGPFNSLVNGILVKKISLDETYLFKGSTIGVLDWFDLLLVVGVSDGSSNLIKSLIGQSISNPGANEAGDTGHGDDGKTTFGIS
jgi:hypothetical protein